MCAFFQFGFAADGDGGFGACVVHVGEVFVYQPPVAVVLHEVTHAFRLFGGEAFVGEDVGVGVPFEEGLAAVYHDAVVVGAVAAVGGGGIEVEHGQAA